MAIGVGNRVFHDLPPRSELRTGASRGSGEQHAFHVRTTRLQIIRRGIPRGVGLPAVKPRMQTVRTLAKGQVVIPAAVREQLGIQSGTLLEVNSRASGGS